MAPRLIAALLLCSWQGMMVASGESREASKGAPLRPGDSVRIAIWRQAELSGDYTVDEDGGLTLPLIGRIQAGSVSPDSLKILLVSGYSLYLNEPSITVTPLFRITVMGEVARPGLYPVDATVILADLLALAGGITEAGDTHKVSVIRGGEVVVRDLSRSLQEGRGLEEGGIVSGDQVVVGRRGGLGRADLAVVAALLSATGIILSVVLR